MQKRCMMDVKCRVCGHSNEAVYYLVCLYPAFYLNVRHNITKIMYQELIQNVKLIQNPPEITKIGDLEYWHDLPIKLTPKGEKNKPDIVIWDKKEMQCRITEVTVPLGTNLQKAANETQVEYIQLITMSKN